MSDYYLTLTLRQRLDRFPPFMVLALSRIRIPPQTPAECRQRLWCSEARKERERLRRRGIELPRRKMIRRMTFEELAKKSGLTMKQLQLITRRLTWDETPVGQMLSFLEACGVNLLKAERINRQLKIGLKENKLFTHLDKQEMAQFVAYAARFRKKKQNYESKPIPSNPPS